ncbi:hypothetical protein COB18_02410 [Candidatus Kaiserbacteria bacterium]|nr:MAG: hypothetical protein COB18_02410 [Candidatus Kaiserbacteria bacterium]
MIDVDVAKLANLTRMAVSDEEMKDLEREIPEILAFIDQITQAGGEVIKEPGEHYNIMRKDENPHESGEHTDELLAAMPDTKNGYLRVRKIITQD